MDYTIKRSNGDLYASIPANVIIGPNITLSNMNPTPINLIGRNRISYGQPQNENFLWLTENFASSTAPASTIVGQQWFKVNQLDGQMLIAAVDNARNPISTNTDTENDWYVVPAIRVYNNLPDPTSSLMGRMALTNSGDSLKVLMKNKEWREIQTVRSLNKEYDQLLDIAYDAGTSYISFSSATPTKPVAYFNSGAAEETLSNGYVDFQDGQGALQFGSSYFFEFSVIGRRVNLVNGSIVSVPQVFKTWKLTGSFYVNNKGAVDVTTITPSQLPDPRRVTGLTYANDVYTDAGSDTDGWSITLLANSADPSLAQYDVSTIDGFTKYVKESLNSSIHRGLQLQATINNVPVGQTYYTQWSVLLRMTGIPPLGV